MSLQWHYKNQKNTSTEFQFKFVFTKAAELQFLSQVQWLGFALCTSKGMTEIQPLSRWLWLSWQSFPLLFCHKDIFRGGSTGSPHASSEIHVFRQHEDFSSTKGADGNQSCSVGPTPRGSQALWRGIADFWPSHWSTTQNKCIIVLNLLLSTTSSTTSSRGLTKKLPGGKGEWNSTRRLLPDVNFLNNVTSWMDSNYKICAQQHELLSWRHDRSSRSWGKSSHWNHALVFSFLLTFPIWRRGFHFMAVGDLNSGTSCSSLSCSLDTRDIFLNTRSIFCPPHLHEVTFWHNCHI